MCLETATAPSHTLSLHDALPILAVGVPGTGRHGAVEGIAPPARGDIDAAFDPGVVAELPDVVRGTGEAAAEEDRKSTRLNSSHTVISYAVFCLKKKNIASVPDQ